MEHFRRKSSADSGVNFLNRALSGLSVQRVSARVQTDDIPTGADAVEDIKGPLGLNLLHVPPEPIVDLIFVHGLGGGSRKTWAYSSHPYHYWPKEWLPRDPDFKNVRIHSFGYMADWVDTKDSILDVNDFAGALLGELQNDPEIRQDDTRIVLVGHSMGGLVIKKLCIMAGQDPKFATLAKRLHTVYFLATPHRGSDLAKTLANILKVTYTGKPYVNDLHRNSGLITAVNDGFRHYSADLQVWSFYETLKSSIGVSNTMIVDKSSATLGYAHERVALLNADHRGVCKFEKPDDPNYNTLRNALSTTIISITSEVFKLRHQTTRDEFRRLTTFIGIGERPEDDLNSLEEIRTPGSCEWFISKREFEDWRDALTEEPHILWLSGNPAAGKSVLASYVIDHLAGQNLEYSYFFFKHGTATKSTVGDCLRSLAYQMLISSVEIRKRLLLLEEDGIVFDKNDEKAIWRKVFLGGIFQSKMVQPHYWVIDGLDECSKFQALMPMISRIESQTPLRIFITSRKTQVIESEFSDLGNLVEHQEIRVADTVDDIKAFVASKIHRLPVSDQENRQKLTDRILAKSAGSFLWVRLVVQELEKTWSEEAVEDVLNNTPSDMNALYMRLVENMSKDHGASKLTKAIITWTVCALRPLTLTEMQSALKLDVKETVYNLDRSIASICGQLLFVDQASTVQIIHQTARDFLLQPNLKSEFAVDRGEAHMRLALICFDVLSGDLFKSPRSQKHRSAKKAPSKDSALVEYACIYFSDHLYKASSIESELMDALHGFLTTNVLSWIEHIARTGNLYHITRIATNLKAFLARRAKYFPPIGVQVQTVESWITDLIRVSAKFQVPLITSPSSIHWLVPPMCPSNSIISQKFTSPNRGITVKGIETSNWDDCLAHIDYRGCLTTTVAHGNRYFAVGLSTGKVCIYHKVSCQLYMTLDHAERVKILAFSDQDKFLASSSLRTINVWNISTGEKISTFKPKHQALSLAFTTDDQLQAATQGNYVELWALQGDLETIQIPWHAGYEEGLSTIHHRQPPTHVVFSSDLNFVAVSCRGEPILLFNLESETFFGNCVRESAGLSKGTAAHYPAYDMTFNPNPDMSFLIASYGDGELVVYDVWTLETRQRLPSIWAHIVACSPDGRTLATGSSFGAIQVFEFGGANMDNLTLIYRINAYEEGIKSLVFSNDSLRFVDVRGSQCRVWEPAVLVRKDLSDDGNSQSEFSDPASLVALTVGMVEGEVEAEITAMACHPSGDVIFCGKHSGEVSTHSTRDGCRVNALYNHNAAVTSIVWGASKSLLVSTDTSGRVLISKVIKNQNEWTVLDSPRDSRFIGSIISIYINQDNDRLLLCGRERDELWDTDGNKIQAFDYPSRSYRRAIPHPLMPEALIVFGANTARIYNWADFSELTQPAGIMILRASESNSSTFSSPLKSSYHGTTILTELVSVPGNKSTHLSCWPTSSFVPSTPTTLASATPLAGFSVLGPKIEHIISAAGPRLLFLDTDLWVCSIDFRTFAATPQAKRHFFIPSDWRNSAGDMLFQLTSRNEFVFAKRNELVIIGRGLDFAEVLNVI